MIFLSFSLNKPTVREASIIKLNRRGGGLRRVTGTSLAGLEREKEVLLKATWDGRRFDSSYRDCLLGYGGIAPSSAVLLPGSGMTHEFYEGPMG